MASELTKEDLDELERFTQWAHVFRHARPSVTLCDGVIFSSMSDVDSDERPAILRGLVLLTQKSEQLVSAARDLAARASEVERLRAALLAIAIRCEQGDKNFDWRQTIADIARAALAQQEPPHADG